MAAHGGRVGPSGTRPAEWWKRAFTPERIAPLVAAAFLLAVWEFYVRTQLPDFVATPIGIVLAIPATVASPSFWSDAAVSLGSAVVFYLIFEAWFKVPLPKGLVESFLGLD